ncbi:MAG: hypothetical protein Fur0035_01430 [Anaerolineales bacterium]
MTLILIQGGGDLGTGIAMRLHRAGFRVLITELAQPLAVRRAVCFSEAIYEGAHSVEGLTARRAATPAEIESAFQRGEIPVVSGRLAVESWQWAVDSFQPPNHPTVQPANRETVQPDNRPTGKPENRKTGNPPRRHH